MRQTGRRLWWTAALLAMLSAAGCTQEDGSHTRLTGDPDALDRRPVTLTYFHFGQGRKDTLLSETIIGKRLLAETGVDFRLQYLTGDSATKAGVMVASGDYPDVISSSGEMAQLLDAGAYIPLDELIARHGPNIERVYSPYYDRMRAEDGKIYTLPFTAHQGYTPDAEIRGGAFYIQRSVLREFGYPRIRTLDEYVELIRRYRDRYPVVDGKPTIGFVIPAGMTNSFYTLQNPAMHLDGYPNDGPVMVDMQTLEAKLVAGTGQQKRWLQKLNEMHALGLFDPESFTLNKDQYLNKLTSGNVLGYFSYQWQIAEADKQLKTAGVDDKRYAPLPLVFDEGTRDQYVDPPGFVNNYGIGISVKAEDPVQIIRYFDHLLKEESQILVSWGIEGETYSVDPQGRFYYTDEQIRYHEDPELSRSYGFAYFDTDWPRYGINSVLADGNAYYPGNQPEVYNKLYTEGDRRILDAYGASTFTGYFSEPLARPWFPAWSIPLPLDSRAEVFLSRAEELQRRELPRLILEPPDAFEPLWEAYARELAALDKRIYEETMTRAVRERARE